jgi:hypothetical protein
VFRPVDIGPLLDAFTERHLFISLRCSRGYPAHPCPKFLSEERFLEWKWTSRMPRRRLWNYPFSVDGTIFPAEVPGRYVSRLSFSAPNSFEGALHGLRHRLRVRRRNRALAPLHAAVFNNPLNKVQSEGETWNAGITPGQINGRYLQGFLIDNAALYRAEPDNAHFAAGLRYIDEETDQPSRT